MKIAFVTAYDPQDIRQFSGCGYHIAKSLVRQGIPLDFIGPLKNRFEAFLWFKKAICKSTSGKRYIIDRSKLLLRDYARQIGKRLEGRTPDFIFSPGTLPLAYLETSIPTAFWTDATFGNLHDFYPYFSNLHPWTISESNAAEQGALSRATIGFYTSPWAAATATLRYGLRQTKVAPFGPNMEIEHSAEQMTGFVKNRPRNRCKLLFLAVEWERKRGAFALSVVEELNRLGCPTTLSVVGCAPAPESADSPFLELHGFIDKSTPTGQAQLRNLLATHHFLIIPSMAEATPVAFSEANAFGVPCVATAVGGVDSVVREGINGYTFHLNSQPREWAAKLREVFQSEAGYERLAFTAYAEYVSRLNWDLSGKTVVGALERILMA